MYLLVLTGDEDVMGGKEDCLCGWSQIESVVRSLVSVFACVVRPVVWLQCAVAPTYFFALRILLLRILLLSILLP